MVRAIREYILRQVCVQSDETPVRMQLRDGKMHQARLWAYGLPWAEVVFDFRTNKSHHGPEPWLKGGRARYLQADGGSSYGPVMENLGELLRLFAKVRPPKTPFAKAMSYAEGQWPAMMRYLEVPEAELDNNSIEHALRSVVMGRRNGLHVGQEVRGERAPNLFTLMRSCRRLGVEPYGYLCDIIPRLGRHPQKDIWDLTPRDWRDARARAAGAAVPPD